MRSEATHETGRSTKYLNFFLGRGALDKDGNDMSKKNEVLKVEEDFTRQMAAQLNVDADALFNESGELDFA